MGGIAQAVSAFVAVDTSKRQRDEAKAARRAGRQEAATRQEEQRKLEEEVEQNKEKTAARKARDEKRARDKARAAGSRGRRSTILTSPQGLEEPAVANAGGRKTLLGT